MTSPAPLSGVVPPLLTPLTEDGEIDLRSLERLVGHLLDGGVDGQGMPVIWSMGNSLATQQPGRSTVMETATGLMTLSTITVPAEGPARVDSVQWMGTVMDSYGDFGLVPLHQAQADPSLTAWDRADIDGRIAWLDELMGDPDAQFTDPPTPTGEPPVVEPRS